MSQINEKVLSWNRRFPWDRIWRKKYNVSFGSKKHLEINFIQQMFDLKEDFLFKSFEDEKLKKKSFDELFGQVSKNVNMSQDEIEKEFDDWDISSL